MGNTLKYSLIFLGGVAVGAIGLSLIKKSEFDFKGLATDLLSRGIDAKDAVLTQVETARENFEDLMAEAQHASDQRKAAPQTQEQSN